MNTKSKEIPWIGREFIENQEKFDLDELAKFAGLHVAYSWDGASIVASGKTDDEVYEKVVAAGIDPERVVYGYVDPL